MTIANFKKFGTDMLTFTHKNDSNIEGLESQVTVAELINRAPILDHAEREALKGAAARRLIEADSKAELIFCRECTLIAWFSRSVELAETLRKPHPRFKEYVAMYLYSTSPDFWNVPNRPYGDRVYSWLVKKYGTEPVPKEYEGFGTKRSTVY